MSCRFILTRGSIKARSWGHREASKTKEEGPMQGSVSSVRDGSVLLCWTATQKRTSCGQLCEAASMSASCGESRPGETSRSIDLRNRSWKRGSRMLE